MNIELEQFILYSYINDEQARELIHKKVRPQFFQTSENKNLFRTLQRNFIKDMKMPVSAYMDDVKTEGVLNVYLDIQIMPFQDYDIDKSLTYLKRDYLDTEFDNAIKLGNGKRALEIDEERKKISSSEDAIYAPDIISDLINRSIMKGLNIEKYSTNIIDDFYKVVRKQTTVITGSPSSGKSNFMDAIAVNMSSFHKWKFLYFSPENQPIELHLMNIARKRESKPVMGTGEKSAVDKWIMSHFKFINTNVIEHSIDLILSIADREEFDGIVIDPWNEISQTEENEKRFISESLSKLKAFSYRKNCHVFVIAHPTKLRKMQSGEYEGMYPPATAYDISGAAEWYSKPDNILSVWRNSDNNDVEVHIQKIKFEGITGRRGKVDLKFRIETGEYL